MNLTTDIWFRRFFFFFFSILNRRLSNGFANRYRSPLRRVVPTVLNKYTIARTGSSSYRLLLNFTQLVTHNLSSGFARRFTPGAQASTPRAPNYVALKRRIFRENKKNVPAFRENAWSRKRRRTSVIVWYAVGGETKEIFRIARRGRTADERTRCARLVWPMRVIRKHNCNSYGVAFCTLCGAVRGVPESAVFRFVVDFFRPRRQSSVHQGKWAKKTSPNRVCSPKKKNNCCRISAETFPPNLPPCSTAVLSWCPLCPSVSIYICVCVCNIFGVLGSPLDNA